MSDLSATPAVGFRAMSDTEQDMVSYANCFANNGLARELEINRWTHVDNPTGRSLVELAVGGDPASGRIAGIYAVMPVWARLDGRRVLACQSLDTLTDEAFRGQGLFVRMAKRAYARATDEGFAFVYGFPNASSAHGFFTKLDWSQLDPIPFIARPLRSGYISGRLTPKLRWLPDLPLPVLPPRLSKHQELRSVVRFGPAHEDVWNAFAARIGVAIDRNAAYLNWRLRDKPGHDYRIIALHERGQLRGFAAWIVTAKHGGRVGYVLELLHMPERPDVGLTLANAVLVDMVASGADIALAWCLPHAPNRSSLRRAGFVDFPERLRPVELHFGARTLAAPSSAALVANRAAWYVSYLDSDTV